MVDIISRHVTAAMVVATYIQSTTEKQAGMELST